MLARAKGHRWRKRLQEVKGKVKKPESSTDKTIDSQQPTTRTAAAVEAQDTNDDVMEIDDDDDDDDDDDTVDATAVTSSTVTSTTTAQQRSSSSSSPLKPSGRSVLARSTPPSKQTSSLERTTPGGKQTLLLDPITGIITVSKVRRAVLAACVSDYVFQRVVQCVSGVHVCVHVLETTCTCEHV